MHVPSGLFFSIVGDCCFVPNLVSDSVIYSFLFVGDCCFVSI